MAALVEHPMTATQRIREVWQYREVIRNFVSQDLKVKYRRSVLGFFWSLLHPLLMIFILSIVFTQLFRFGGMKNYPLYILTGLPVWSFFAITVDGCSISIINNEAYLKRQYFPKLIFPTAIVAQNLVSFFLSMTALLTFLGWFLGFRLSPAMAVLPLSFACVIAMALGVGAAVAALTVYFRDLQHLVSVGLNAWFYLTPIIWPIEEMTNPTMQTIIKLNPMYYIMRMFRAPLHEGVWPSPSEMLIAVGASTAILLIGLMLFWWREDDLIFKL